MEVLIEVVKTLLLDMNYSSLDLCIESFKSRIKTQKGIDSILLLVDYQSILDYLQVTDMDMNLYNKLLYTIAKELIKTPEIQHAFYKEY